MEISNRTEGLVRSPAGPGVRSTGEWTSVLDACQVNPLLGRWVMRNALRDWPIRLASEGRDHERPEISFVIPFRGEDRLPQLRLVVASLLAQEEVRVECIVVEQADVAVTTELPPGVRHLHLPHPDDSIGWRKSWAVNVGVETARGDIVVCHDADILAPSGYAREIRRWIGEQGFEAAHLEHLLFRLDREHTARIAASRVVRPGAPEEISYNWPGGTLAIRRDAFFRIGGFDEDFVDWGGEDNEFRDRCSVLLRYNFGYLPFIHLWHPPQDTKHGDAREANLAMMKEKLAISAWERVEALTAPHGGR